MRKRVTALLLAVSLATGMGGMNVYGTGENMAVESNVAAEVSGSDGTYAKGTEYVSSCNLERKEDMKAANDDFSSAVSIRLGNTINDSITETVDNRLYQFTLSESGRVTLDLTSYMQYCSLYIYGSDGTQIWYDDNNVWNESLKYFKNTYEVDLTNGTYYLKMTGYRYRTSSSYASTGIYAIATKFTSAKESCAEPNNDFMETSTIGINCTVRGQIAENDEYDIYKFSLQKSGRIRLTMTYYMQYNSINLYDSTGEEIWYSYDNVWNGNLRYKTDTYNLDLISGTYYLKVTGYRYRNSSAYADTGNYEFVIKFTDAKVNYQEPNNDFSEAYVLRTDTNLKGQIAINDPYDIFKFSLPKSKDIKITMTSYMKYYTLDLYNNAGEKVWNTNWNKWNENVGYRKDMHTVTLSAGSYYLKVTGYSSGTSNASTGTYTLQIGTKVSVVNATVSVPDYLEYTGKAMKPTVVVKYNNMKLQKGKDYELSYQNNKNIGTATVTIAGKGNYTGTKKVTLRIVPKKVKIIKVQNTGRRRITLKWKLDKNVTGYEIYRSLQKSSGYRKIKILSKNGIISYRNKNLQKGKKYYYIIRSYKTVKGKRYFGAFSKAKGALIKK